MGQAHARSSEGTVGTDPEPLPLEEFRVWGNSCCTKHNGDSRGFPWAKRVPRCAGSIKQEVPLSLPSGKEHGRS